MVETKPLDLGAQDPELENSPIETEVTPEDQLPELNLEGAHACYFNGRRYPHGTWARSGPALLRCEYGVWVQTGSADPDNP